MDTRHDTYVFVTGVACGMGLAYTGIGGFVMGVCIGLVVNINHQAARQFCNKLFVVGRTVVSTQPSNVEDDADDT